MGPFEPIATEVPGIPGGPGGPGGPGRPWIRSHKVLKLSRNFPFRGKNLNDTQRTWILSKSGNPEPSMSTNVCKNMNQ